MIKPRMRYRAGRWWCRRLGVNGFGDTPREAWDAMWRRYHGSGDQ